ncbi:MAG: hypothetical protein EOM83_05270 [Clostridia bacterium]|nr:hypothetical protein [Clostridia bacterium]
MKNLSVTISNEEIEKFGINKESLTFAELLEMIKNEISKQNLNVVTEIAERYGLSKMTMNEIDEEVKAVRNAKDNH